MSCPHVRWCHFDAVARGFRGARPAAPPLIIVQSDPRGDASPTKTPDPKPSTEPCDGPEYPVHVAAGSVFSTSRHWPGNQRTAANARTIALHLYRGRHWGSVRGKTKGLVGQAHRTPPMVFAGSRNFCRHRRHSILSTLSPSPAGQIGSGPQAFPGLFKSSGLLHHPLNGALPR